MLPGLASSLFSSSSHFLAPEILILTGSCLLVILNPAASLEVLVDSSTTEYPETFSSSIV